MCMAHAPPAAHYLRAPSSAPTFLEQPALGSVQFPRAPREIANRPADARFGDCADGTLQALDEFIPRLRMVRIPRALLHPQTPLHFGPHVKINDVEVRAPALDVDMLLSLRSAIV